MSFHWSGLLPQKHLKKFWSLCKRHHIYTNSSSQRNVGYRVLQSRGGKFNFFISSVSRGKQKKKFSVQMKGLIVFKELERQRWPQNGQHLLQIPFSYFLFVHFWCFTSTFWKYEIELAEVVLHRNAWVLELFFFNECAHTSICSPSADHNCLMLRLTLFSIRDSQLLIFWCLSFISVAVIKLSDQNQNIWERVVHLTILSYSSSF